MKECVGKYKTACAYQNHQRTVFQKHTSSAPPGISEIRAKAPAVYFNKLLGCS